MASFECAVCALLRNFLVCVALAAAAFELTIPETFAQTAAQQRVYGSGSITTNGSAIPGYSKDNTTGALTVLPGAPFADRLEGGLVAIDGTGKFLFVLNRASALVPFAVDAANLQLVLTPQRSLDFASGAFCRCRGDLVISSFGVWRGSGRDDYAGDTDRYSAWNERNHGYGEFRRRDATDHTQLTLPVP